MQVAIGAGVRVPRDSFTRSGHDGYVLESYDDGGTIEFGCDAFGDRQGVPSIEFWYWRELEIEGRPCELSATVGEE